MQILRTPQRRADCAPLDALGARRKTRRVHVARRAGCAPEDAPVARRKTRRLRAGRRAVCAPEDAPVALRKTRQESERSLEVVGRVSRRVADGAVISGRLGQGAFLSPLAATRSSTEH